MAVVAAWKGLYKVLKWSCALRPLGQVAVALCKVVAAEYGQRDMLRLLQGVYPAMPASLRPCIVAAHEGYLQALKLLSSTDPACILDESVSLMACRQGHIERVEWLLTQPGIEILPIRRWACGAGSLPMLCMLEQYGLLHDIQSPAPDISPVACHGDLKTLQILEHSIRPSNQHFKYGLVAALIAGSGPLSGLTEDLQQQVPPSPSRPTLHCRPPWGHTVALAARRVSAECSHGQKVASSCRRVWHNCAGAAGCKVSRHRHPLERSHAQPCCCLGQHGSAEVAGCRACCSQLQGCA